MPSYPRDTRAYSIHDMDKSVRTNRDVEGAEKSMTLTSDHNTGTIVMGAADLSIEPKGVGDGLAIPDGSYKLSTFAEASSHHQQSGMKKEPVMKSSMKRSSYMKKAQSEYVDSVPSKDHGPGLDEIDEEADGSQCNDGLRVKIVKHQTLQANDLDLSSPDADYPSHDKKIKFKIDDDFADKQSMGAVTGITTGSHITFVGPPSRAEKNKLYLFMYHFCIHPAFALFITIMIIWNTVVLASDTYPPDRETVELNALLNSFFTYCFLAEMIIRMLGLGIKEYAKDRFNIFDASIVIVSMIEIAMDEAGITLSNAGAFSAFRSIRLLRTFKLVRSWK